MWVSSPTKPSPRLDGRPYVIQFHHREHFGTICSRLISGRQVIWIFINRSIDPTDFQMCSIKMHLMKSLMNWMTFYSLSFLQLFSWSAWAPLALQSQLFLKIKLEYNFYPDSFHVTLLSEELNFLLLLPSLHHSLYDFHQWNPRRHFYTWKLKTRDIKNAKLFLLPVRYPAYFEVFICHDLKESESFDEAIHSGRYSICKHLGEHNSYECQGDELWPFTYDHIVH